MVNEENLGRADLSDHKVHRVWMGLLEFTVHRGMSEPLDPKVAREDKAQKVQKGMLAHRVLRVRPDFQVDKVTVEHLDRLDPWENKDLWVLLALLETKAKSATVVIQGNLDQPVYADLLARKANQALPVQRVLMVMLDSRVHRDCPELKESRVVGANVAQLDHLESQAREVYAGLQVLQDLRDMKAAVVRQVAGVHQAKKGQQDKLEWRVIQVLQGLLEKRVPREMLDQVDFEVLLVQGEPVDHVDKLDQTEILGRRDLSAL